MPIMSAKELRDKETALKTKIERTLPDFAKSCRGNEDVVLLHQDSFAADYQHDEYVLLGMAIKYAGLYGKEVRIIGTNRQTLNVSGNPELLQ